MYKNFIPGLMFAILWATGSVAAKAGIRSADALILASIRFIGTGILFGPFFIIHTKYRFLPTKQEFKIIFTYGLLNTTLTLGAFFASQKYASAGISTLFIAMSPLFMALFASIFLKRTLSRFEITGIVTAFAGLMISAASELSKGQVKPLGLLLLTVYIMAYSFSAIYFSSKQLSIPVVVFNVWQVFIGGLMLLPFSWLLNDYHIRHIDLNLLLALCWMIVVLSFIANQIWLYLVKQDPVKAATWLYLTPVFGYIYGYLLLHEKITAYSIAGTIIVIAGLMIAAKKVNKRSDASSS